jgi:hypothetical protein
MKTNIFFIIIISICKLYITITKKIFSKFLDNKNNKEDQGNKREYTRITRIILINKIKNSNSYIYYY